MADEEKGGTAKRYTMDEVADHKTRDSLYLVMKNKVYDVTDYIDKHPGGPDKFLDNAGTDVTKQFEESHNSKIPSFIAQNYEIGVLSKKALKEKTNEVNDAAASSSSVKEASKKPKQGQGDSGADKDQTFSTEYNLTEEECAITRRQFGQLAVVAGSVIEAGNLIYDALYIALGPAAVLFKSPKKVLAFRVITQVERFVNHVEDKEFLEVELYNMSMRHLAYVSYEEMKQHMVLFVGTIVGVIKNALDEYWNDASNHAWMVFFKYLGAHLLKNAQEFGGKVRLLRSSWAQVEELRNKDQKGEGNSTGGFGDALFFNLGVMSPEITSLIIRDRSELADLFTAGFNMLVTFVSDPPVMNEELYILAARHLEYGTEEHHFPVFGQAVMVTLRSLLPRTWNWAHEDAWGWLWNMSSKFMISTIANGHAHKQRLDDSMTRLEGVDMDELGAQFYGVLFAASVEVQQYFYKPNSLVKFIVSKVLQIIVAILHFPDATTHGIRALGMRHIKYAIPPDLFPLFGVSLTGTLPSFLEGFWDENIREAWATVFEFVKDCMTRAVLSGTNLVTKALVSNNATDCEDALSAAPRNERIIWLLEIDVSNIKVSPFQWALQDAKFEVARFMLNDTLVIRADREAYYYGKDVLFRVHQDLIDMLCRLSPPMLFNVFDGLMWHSRNIVDGQRRVNYYIRDVYGNPNVSEYEDSFATPLAHLTRLRNSEVFTHPFVLFLLVLKWKQIGFNIYLRMQLINIMTLLFFMLGWVILDINTDEAFACRVLAVTLVAFTLCYYQLPRIVRELIKFHVTRICWGVYVPVFLSKITNAGRFIANIALVIAFVTDVKVFPNNDTAQRISSWGQGIACCLMFTLLIETAQLNITLLRFQHKLGAVGFQFMIYLLCILFTLIGFATSLVLSEGKSDDPSHHFDSLWDAILNLFASILGLYNFRLEGLSGQMLIFFVLFCMVSIFLFTRLLLAIMSTITIEEDHHVEGFAFLERAELAIELESSCAINHRKSLWNTMNMDAPLLFDAGDLGPSGGLQVREIVGRQMSQRAADDRIIRYPGECNPGKPWPRITGFCVKSTEERVDKLAEVGEKIRRTLVDMQKRGLTAGAKGVLPTLSEGESGTGFEGASAAEASGVDE
eukprot:GEMP01003006.1.p1 GENE.GEMP01003006.1~~GEMP01003006.1.p1  ORF type:complete len:1130 (+),score=154.99 GEMP01003006.1:81-3470(+)